MYPLFGPQLKLAEPALDMTSLMWCTLGKEKMFDLHESDIQSEINPKETCNVWCSQL